MLKKIGLIFCVLGTSIVFASDNFLNPNFLRGELNQEITVSFDLAGEEPKKYESKCYSRITLVKHAKGLIINNANYNCFGHPFSDRPMSLIFEGEDVYFDNGYGHANYNRGIIGHVDSNENFSISWNRKISRGIWDVEMNEEGTCPLSLRPVWKKAELEKIVSWSFEKTEEGYMLTRSNSNQKIWPRYQYNQECNIKRWKQTVVKTVNRTLSGEIK